MNLDKQVTITNSSSLNSGQANKTQELSLFQAIRLVSDAESATFEIMLDGKTFNNAQVQEIVHSEEFKDALLAFDERR
jgi:hypothetical protein